MERLSNVQIVRNPQTYSIREMQAQPAATAPTQVKDGDKKLRNALIALGAIGAAGFVIYKTGSINKAKKVVDKNAGKAANEVAQNAGKAANEVAQNAGKAADKAVKEVGENAQAKISKKAQILQGKTPEELAKSYQSANKRISGYSTKISQAQKEIPTLEKEATQIQQKIQNIKSWGVLGEAQHAQELENLQSALLKNKETVAKKTKSIENYKTLITKNKNYMNDIGKTGQLPEEILQEARNNKHLKKTAEHSANRFKTIKENLGNGVQYVQSVDKQTGKIQKYTQDTATGDII